ncbi:MAG TPA: M42 family metallopeptidase [Actinomycetota bacterium]|nr:M42 family metallopeptidase [Actinomycetota bacterium]
MNAELFKDLVSTPGISGREERIRDIVQKHMSELVDETRIDALGNLVGIRHGSGPRVMLCAHMDSIGFLVSHIDDNGFLRISPVGGFDPRTLVMQRVVVCGEERDFTGLLAPSSKPIHLLTGDEAKKPPKIEDLFIDLMLPADEVKAGVAVGDPVSLVREPLITDGAVTAPYLDDRLGVYVVLEALRKAARNDAEIYTVISVQEEVGVRGATTAAFEIEPAVGVAVDVTIAGDLPGADRSQQVCALGQGAAIGLMDSGSISDPRLVRSFKRLAEDRTIPYQMEILPRGGTDAGGIQLTRAGVPVITISIPIRYVHTVNEMAYVSDIDATVDLVAAYVETAHQTALDWTA